MSVTRGRPVIVAVSTHPGEEEILLEVHRTLAGFFPTLLTVIVPRHPGRGEAIARTIAACGSARRPAFARRTAIPRPPTSMSPTPWASWGCSTGCRRSCSWEDRWSNMAGKSDRGGQARRVDRARPSCFQFLPTFYEALDNAGGAKRADTQEALVKQLASCWRDPAARICRPRPASGWARTRWRARSHAGCAGAPCCSAPRNGGFGCMSRSSGTGHHHGCRDC